MRKRSSEIWVGIFVVIGIVLLAAMTLKVEKFQFGKEKGYLLSVYFDSATGLAIETHRCGSLGSVWGMWKGWIWSRGRQGSLFVSL